MDYLVDITEIDEMLDDMGKQLGDNNAVKAGYFENKRYPDTGLEIAENALQQEYGTILDGKIIPPRPFLSMTLSKNEDKWYQIFSAEMDKGKDVTSALKRVGEEMRNDIIRQIDSNIPPPHSPLTVKKKGSSHTLIDSGTMRRSTSYELEK